MAAADVERSVNSVIETLLNELEGTFSPKEKQMTALRALVEKQYVFVSSLSAAWPISLIVEGLSNAVRFGLCPVTFLWNHIAYERFLPSWTTEMTVL